MRHDRLPITLDGLAKGYILDAVCHAISSKHAEVTEFSINIGGDLRKVGSRPQAISITTPTNSADNAAALQTFTIDRPLALATSGNYRRNFLIADRNYSHIFDPRTCMPADEIVSASVIAFSAMDADALATACSVLAPQQSLALIATLPDAACLLVAADGRRFASPNWPAAGEIAKAQFVAADDAAASTGLHVKFTLNRPQGGRYRRPFVAVWLEDKDGFPVKTAVLWLQKDQPGPRWHRDLSRWYRNDRTRKVVEKSDLIDTISGATRGPGQYEARFDGTDNAGKPLPDGDYVLCLEAAREHGTYQIIRQPLKLGGEAIALQKLKGNVEMSEASYEYAPPSTTSATEAP